MAIDTSSTSTSVTTVSSVINTAALSNMASSAMTSSAQAANDMFSGMLKQLSESTDMLGQTSLSSRGMAHDVDCTDREVHGGFGGRNTENTKSTEKESKSESSERTSEKDTSYKDEKVEESADSKRDNAEVDDGESSENEDSKVTAEEEELLVAFYGMENFSAIRQAKSAEGMSNSSQYGEGLAGATTASEAAIATEDSLSNVDVKELMSRAAEAQKGQNANNSVSGVLQQQAETIASKIGDNDNLSVKVNVQNSGDKSILQNSAGNAALSAMISEDAGSSSVGVSNANSATLALVGQNLNNGGNSAGNNAGQQGQNSANYMTAGLVGNMGNTTGKTSGEAVQTTIVNGVAIKGTSAQVTSVANSAMTSAGMSSSAANANVAAGSGMLGSSSLTLSQKSSTSELAGKTALSGDFSEKMNSQNVVDQVKVNITKAFGSGNDKIQIQLRPASLGKVDVSLEISNEGSLKAVISASDKTTHEMLQRDAGSLGQALKDAGLKADADSIEFQYKGDAENQSNYAENNGDNVGDGQGNQNEQNLTEEQLASGSLQTEEIEENNLKAIETEDSDALEEGRLNIQV